MHDLQYCDPVMHVLLGLMHNWLEGILAHQLHTLWGIGHKVCNGCQIETMRLYCISVSSVLFPTK